MWINKLKKHTIETLNKVRVECVQYQTQFSLFINKCMKANCTNNDTDLNLEICADDIEDTDYISLPYVFHLRINFYHSTLSSSF